MFEKIIGNDNIKQKLKSSIMNDTVLHSYMFVGVRRYWQEDVCNRICKSYFMPD